MSDYLIRRLTKDEMLTAVKWAADEGWNPGLHDAECFYSCDPNGWWGGFLNGKLIATISAVDYGSEFAFVGFYIVHPDYRGKGYGYKLWKEALASIEKRNIGLDGVVAEQENYKKSGFKLAYRNKRYEGLSFRTQSEYSNIVPVSEIGIDKLIEFDSGFFPDNRSNFIRCWLRLPESFSYAWVEDDNIKGYGTIRKCGKGYKIGPLFCETPEIASALFMHLINQITPGEFFYLDIPEPNEAAQKLVVENGMKFVFETARMYTRKDPGLPVNLIYGVTTFELG